jgi:hypothetical protein
MEKETTGTPGLSTIKTVKPFFKTFSTTGRLKSASVLSVSSAPREAELVKIKAKTKRHALLKVKVIVSPKWINAQAVNFILILDGTRGVKRPPAYDVLVK